MQTMITIMKMIDLGTVPSTYQVWIIPGSSTDFVEDNGEYSGWYISHYLEKRGVCIAKNLEGPPAEGLIKDVKAKFEKCGVEVVVEVTAND